MWKHPDPVVLIWLLLAFPLSLAQNGTDTTVSPMPTETTPGMAVNPEGNNPDNMIGREPSPSNQMPSTPNQGQPQPIDEGEQAGGEPSGEPPGQGQNPQEGPDVQAGQQPANVPSGKPPADCYISCRLTEGPPGATVPGEIISEAVDPVIVNEVQVPVPVPASPAYFHGFPHHFYGGGPFRRPWGGFRGRFHRGPFFGHGHFGRWKRQTGNVLQKGVMSGSRLMETIGEGESEFMMELHGTMYSCRKVCQ